ncbi:MAG TPA: non-homologous end-joining DNA ligase [Pyrinomonadaceae bacterium]|jgi:bifunctional non-homologous end joining protein LigD|nr:non-homologous end-joining DNA ligase [Pyrinomonadaceae bacterium]
MGLETYRKKRDFKKTPEPRGRVAKRNLHRFVVQEHHASHLHFDFRLEMGGVLKSWSVRKGPTLDPQERRLAVETEDHPVEYAKFEGHIPAGEYGGGEHMLWDEGKYEPTGGADALAQYEAGRMKFELKGKKLRGTFNLVRLGGREGQWLLIKSRDAHAEPGWKLELRVADDEAAKRWRGEAAGRSSRRKAASKKGVRKFSTKPKGDAETVAASKLFKSKELGGDVNVKVGGAVVPLTSLDRVYFPAAKLTKGDLVRYYYEISDHILPYLKDRPLIMKRYPAGIKGQSFHQHDVNEAPDFVRTVPLEVEDGGGHTVDYVVGDSAATLLYMANLGAIERHPWHSRTRNLDRPDWFVFDLDPGEGVKFETICEVAVTTRKILERLGLESYPKTSGSRGIHIYVPTKAVYGYDEIAVFAARVAALVAAEHPEAATVERSKSKRGKRTIYVDHMQNARGKSVVAPYSVRPREGAPVSAPLTWREVEAKRITPQDFTVENVLARVRAKGDLFRDVLANKQPLGEATRKLESLTGGPKARASGA